MKINFIKHKGRLIPYDDEARQKIDEFKDGCIYVVDINNSDKRTLQQNKLIHQFCKNIEIEAKKQGFTLKQLIKDGTSLSMLSVKELMFKPIVMQKYGKDSTTKLNTDELNLIFDTLILALSHYGFDTSNLIINKE